MKKYYCIIMVVVLCFYMCSCYADPAQNGESVNEPRPDYYQYDFASFDELCSFIASEAQGTCIPAVNSGVNMDIYLHFIDSCNQEGFPVPYSDGIEVPLRQGEHIAFFTHEIYGLPWIWYFITVDDVRTIVRVTRLADEYLEHADDLSCSELIRLIAPTYPNVDDYSGTSFSCVYETDLQLADRTVSAVVFQSSEYNWEYVSFVYDNYMIDIRGSTNFASSDWLQTLSFELYEVS